MNTFFLARYKKLPFDNAMLGDPSSYLPAKETLKFPSIIDIATSAAMPPGLSDDVLARAKQAVREKLDADLETVPLATPPAPHSAPAQQMWQAPQSNAAVSFNAIAPEMELNAMMSFQAPTLKMQSIHFEEMKPDVAPSAKSTLAEVQVDAEHNTKVRP